MPEATECLQFILQEEEKEYSALVRRLPGEEAWSPTGDGQDELERRQSMGRTQEWGGVLNEKIAIRWQLSTGGAGSIRKEGGYDKALR
jgi:hypothetical protein